VILPSGEKVNLTIKVLKVEDGKFVIDFQKTQGDQIKYLEVFSDIKEYMSDYINATA
jgi:hypothetical protein